ncbi:MAG: hypothetical protein U0361_04155 [Nitrospiraceae bacterium]
MAFADFDYVARTHPQLDHVGGLTWVLGHFTVGTFWTNGMARRNFGNGSIIRPPGET